MNLPKLSRALLDLLKAFIWESFACVKSAFSKKFKVINNIAKIM